MSKLYNSELKESFLLKYDNNLTQDYYRQTLEKVTDYERRLYKDIKDFNENELLSVLGIFEAKTLDSLDSRVAALRQYLDYCKERGLIAQNLLKSISRENYEKEVTEIDKSDRIISSRDELYRDFCDVAINAQDAVIFALVFEGIKGTQNQELINLKVEDIKIDENKIIVRNLKNNEIEREVIVKERSIEIVKKAIAEDVYCKYIYNPNSENMKAPLERKLNITSYLIRTMSQNEKDLDEPVGWQVVNNRLKRVAIMLNRPFISTQTVYTSGIYVELKELEDEKGTLDTEDYKEVIKRHGGNADNYYSIKDYYTNYFK